MPVMGVMCNEKLDKEIKELKEIKEINEADLKTLSSLISLKSLISLTPILNFAFYILNLHNHADVVDEFIDLATQFVDDASPNDGQHNKCCGR